MSPKAEVSQHLYQLVKTYPSEEEVRDAVKEFLSRGGHITHIKTEVPLPPARKVFVGIDDPPERLKRALLESKKEPY